MNIGLVNEIQMNTKPRGSECNPACVPFLLTLPYAATSATLSTHADSSDGATKIGPPDLKAIHDRGVIEAAVFNHK
jgi:hypothetical protein